MNLKLGRVREFPETVVQILSPRVFGTERFVGKSPQVRICALWERDGSCADLRKVPFHVEYIEAHHGVPGAGYRYRQVFETLLLDPPPKLLPFSGRCSELKGREDECEDRGGDADELRDLEAAYASITAAHAAVSTPAA